MITESHNSLVVDTKYFFLPSSLDHIRYITHWHKMNSGCHIILWDAYCLSIDTSNKVTW